MYEEELDTLNNKLKAAIEEQRIPSIFEGWDPAAAADREMDVFNGGKKKSKSKKSKSKKSKRTKSTKGKSNK